MSKKEKIFVWTGIGIGIAAVLFLWYVAAYQSKDHQIENTRKLFESDLDFFGRVEPTRRHNHIKQILEESLVAMAKPNALEKPYVLYALLTEGFERVDEHGYVSFVVHWLERGFECTGIRISFTKDETNQTIEVPFPSNIWDEKNRKRYKKYCCRSFKFIGMVCKDHILFQLKHRDDAGSLRVYA
ncbi:MAG: hypothetical protein ACYS8Y_10775, partial [Planctomycetota bacterium]